MQTILFDRGANMLPALTIHQLWAWAIMAGHKQVENRGWRTSYRGPLVIHAGQSRKSLPASLELLDALGIAPPAVAELPFGYLVGIVDLVDIVDEPTACDRYQQADWAIAGSQCWILENPRPFATPIAYKGQQNLFKVQVPQC